MVRPQPSPYAKVEVRGLYWEAVPGVEEYHMVMDAFHSYGYNVKRLILPTTENELTTFPAGLQERVHEIGSEHPSTLIILYYQGHGGLDEYGNLVLSNNGSRLHFNEIASAIINAPCDVLTILNCCHAGAAITSSVASSRPNYEDRIKQVMMAVPSDQKTPYGCADGFSASLEQALRESRFNWQEGFRGSPSQWVDSINKVMDKRVGRRPVTVEHLAMPPSFTAEKPIVLGPMSTTTPPSSNPSTSKPPSVNPAATAQPVSSQTSQSRQSSQPPSTTKAPSRPPSRQATRPPSRPPSRQQETRPVASQPVRPASRQESRPPPVQAMRAASPPPASNRPAPINVRGSRSRASSSPPASPFGGGPMVVNIGGGARRVSHQINPPSMDSVIRDSAPASGFSTSWPGSSTNQSSATRMGRESSQSRGPGPTTWVVGGTQREPSRGRGMTQPMDIPMRGMSQAQEAPRGRGMSTSQVREPPQTRRMSQAAPEAPRGRGMSSSQAREPPSVRGASQAREAAAKPRQVSKTREPASKPTPKTPSSKPSSTSRPPVTTASAPTVKRSGSSSRSSSKEKTSKLTTKSSTSKPAVAASAPPPAPRPPPPPAPKPPALSRTVPAQLLAVKSPKPSTAKPPASKPLTKTASSKQQTETKAQPSSSSSSSKTERKNSTGGGTISVSPAGLARKTPQATVSWLFKPVPKKPPGSTEKDKDKDKDKKKDKENKDAAKKLTTKSKPEVSSSSSSKKPLGLSGGGVRLSRSGSEAKKLAEKENAVAQRSRSKSASARLWPIR